MQAWQAALTQLPNGSVLLNMRHRDAPTKGRARALSNDGGETFGPITYDSTLVSPVCQARPRLYALIRGKTRPRPLRKRKGRSPHGV